MKNLVFLFTSILFSQFVYSQSKEFEFNATSSYIDCGTINLTGSEVTIGAWIKPKTFKLSNPYITSIGGIEQTNNSCLLRLGDNIQDEDKVQFVLRINSQQVKLNGTIQLSSNKWHHIVGSYDGSYMKIYVDGMLDTSQSQTGMFTANSKFEIGRNYDDVRIIDGSIDEFFVFKKALSQATIRDWMCKEINSTHPNYSDLEGYWSLNTKSGSTTSDNSGNGHNGTLIMSPTHQASTAPIGDESSTSYSTPSSLSLSHTDGDKFYAKSITGNPDGVHIYLINGKALNTKTQGAYINFDTSRYWGVHFVGGINPKYTAEYEYLSNVNLINTNPCFFDLVKRKSAATSNWDSLTTIITSSKISISNQLANEYTLGYSGSLSKSLSVSSNGIICGSDSINISHTSFGLSYTWIKNGIPQIGDTLNFLKTNSAGTYKLALKAGNCSDTTNEITLKARSKPSVSLAPFDPVCEDINTVLISGGSPSGGKYDTQYKSGNFFIVISSGPGSFPITYTITDTSGCEGVATQYLQVVPLPTIIFDSLPTPCIDSGIIKLTQALPKGGVYKLNGDTITEINTSILGSGTHSINYIYLDSIAGCKGEKNEQFTINAKPFVQLIINDSICENEGTYKINMVVPTGGVLSGAGITMDIFNPEIAGVGTHKIDYFYRDPNTRCTNQDSSFIEVLSKPAMPIISENNNDTLLSSNGLGNQWYDSSGVIIGETRHYYAPDFNGGFYVITTNENGCISDTSEIYSFTINPIDTTGNGGGGDGSWILTNNQLDKIQLYPNPSNGSIYFHSDGLDIESIQVLNSNGQIIEHKNFSGQNVQLFLWKGIYIIEFYSKEKTLMERKKVIIQ